MTVYIQGNAPANILKELGIIPAGTITPDYARVNYITRALETRTAIGARDLLELLSNKEESVDSLWLTEKNFDESKLALIEEILEISGEPQDIETLRTLKENGTFKAFIAPMD